MNTIALLLSCSPSHPIDAFDWGVAELSNILYRGVTYDHVEVDFIAGEIRFFRHWNDRDPVHNVPTLRRFINASIQSCACPHKEDPPSLDTNPPESFDPSRPLTREVSGLADSDS